MAGHSKWNNIKRTKGINDAKKNKIFTKLVRDIANAVKIGDSGDVEMNPMLKVVVNKAKTANLPNDKIKYAIDRGLGVTKPGEELVINTYEVYGPGGVAILIDTETDNSNRTLTDVRTLVNKSGYKLANEGSIIWQFEEVGQIILSKELKYNSSDIELGLLEIDGVKDIKLDEEGQITIITERSLLKDVSISIQEKLKDMVNIELVELIMFSKESISINEEVNEKLGDFIDQINDLDDVTAVWCTRLV